MSLPIARQHRRLHRCARMCSIAFCATVVLWTTSCVLHIWLALPRVRVILVAGTMIIELYSEPRTTPVPPTTWAPRFDMLWQFPTLAFYDSMIFIRLPLWFLAACIVIMWMATTVLFAKQRRRRCECTWCGYDVRHNVSGRCPECGHPIESSRTAQ